MTNVQTTRRYDPNATYEVSSRDVEYLSHGSASLMVRIYQPRATGTFPAMIAVHGGAWSGKEWLQNEPAHRELAEGGLVVAAIQLRSSVDAPHPAAMQDINYATRWLKANAAALNADPNQVCGLGWSSGGHQIMLSAMRPRHYDDIALADATDVDGGLSFVIMGWPVIDPVARYRLAQERDNQDLVGKHNAYFGDEAGMEEASPPHILRRGEPAKLPPALLLQGAADEALPQGMAEGFAELYSAAGGVIELAKYPGAPHGFMREDGPNQIRAFALAKSFIARQAS